MSGSISSIRLEIVVFPAPLGEDSTNMSPRLRELVLAAAGFCWGLACMMSRATSLYFFREVKTQGTCQPKERTGKSDAYLPQLYEIYK
jgi:hypothetical protein